MAKKCPIRKMSTNSILHPPNLECEERFCAWWDEEHECCACKTFMTSGSKQGEEALKTVLSMLGGSGAGEERKQTL